MLFDAHIHLLPGVGGDPTDISESYLMLDRINEAGVRGALSMTMLDPYRLPPIIYRMRCEEKIPLLRAYVKSQRYPIRLIFATELLWRPGIHKDFDLTQFLVQGTHYLPLLFLAEPMTNDWMRDLSHYVSRLHFTPIVCHFDSQFMLGNGERFLNSASLVFQISAASLRCKRFAKIVLEQMRAGRRFLIGSGAEIPEALLRKVCYSSDDWSLDILQKTVHDRLYLTNNDFRREISYR